MDNTEFDYFKELETFCRARGIWDDEKKEPTRFVTNTLKTIDIPNSTAKQQIFDGFTTKHHKHEYCIVCFEELRGKQKRFCHNCKVNLYEIDEKLEELEKEGAIGIYWQKDPSGKPPWKNMIVRYKDGTEKPLTTKSGKTKKD